MTVWELASEMLEPGTALVLRYSDNPKQKVDRRREVVGRQYGHPGSWSRIVRDGRIIRSGDGLYLRRPDGKVIVSRWPKEGQLEMTGNGFAFFRNGTRYVEYDFEEIEF